MNSRVTLEMAKLILQSADPAKVIAAEHGIAHQTVRLYKRLGNALAKKAKAECDLEGKKVFLSSSTPTTGFTPDDIRAIRKDTRHSAIIAGERKCSPAMIRMIKTGKTYKGIN